MEKQSFEQERRNGTLSQAEIGSRHSNEFKMVNGFGNGLWLLVAVSRVLYSSSLPRSTSLALPAEGQEHVSVNSQDPLLQVCQP